MYKIFQLLINEQCQKKLALTAFSGAQRPPFLRVGSFSIERYGIHVSGLCRPSQFLLCDDCVDLFISNWAQYDSLSSKFYSNLECDSKFVFK